MVDTANSRTSVVLKEIMAYPALVDYDAMFFGDPDAKIIPCGEASVISKNQTKEHIASLFQDGTKDLNFIASCECGHLVGNFYEGMKCKKCGSIVKTNFASELKFRAWLEIPSIKTDPNDPGFIPPILHPALYMILDRWLGRSGGTSILQALLDPDTDMPASLRSSGLGQGYRYFYRNFDDIMNYFLNNYAPLRAPGAKARSKNIKELLSTYRPIVFFRHIPILNQSLHLLTTSGTMMYSDDCSGAILKAKIELSNLLYIYNNGPTGHKFIDQRIWTMYSALLEYVRTISEVKLLGKKGYIRKLILGARLHCSARAVITPISGIHVCDEVHIPWRMGVGLLKCEIINVLMNRYDYSMSEALAKQQRASMQYDSDIDMIMQTLIRECRDRTAVYVPFLEEYVRPKGIMLLVGRNPTLRIGAIMLLFCTRVKTDIDDDTMSISSRLATAPNFDFDGDAMHVLSIKETDMLADLMKLHPSIIMLGGDRPGISGDITITKQEAINLNAWLMDPSQFSPEEKMEASKE